MKSLMGFNSSYPKTSTIIPAHLVVLALTGSRKIKAGVVAAGGQRKARAERGSALSEFGPALFVLFIFAVFPVFDLAYLMVAYGACSTLNSMQLREVAKVPSSQAKAAAIQVEQDWKTEGLGRLAGAKDDPSVSISYNSGENTATGTDVYAVVATNFNIRPLLTIPFFPGVPGLGAPMQWTIISQRLMENPHYAAE